MCITRDNYGFNKTVLQILIKSSWFSGNSLIYSYLRRHISQIIEFVDLNKIVQKFYLMESKTVQNECGSRGQGNLKG